MGRAKQVTHSPHRKSSINKVTNPKPRRKSSLLALVSPDDVTEGTLEVWRTLPSKIRQDPSLLPFQVENERVNGAYVRWGLLYECHKIIWLFRVLGYGVAGPSGINDDVEQEENVETNDEDAVQVHFPNDYPPGRLENVKWAFIHPHEISIFPPIVIAFSISCIR